AADPAAEGRVRRPPGRLPHALGHSDVTRLVTVPVPGGRRPQRDRALLELLYASGLRVSEAVSLEVHHVNLEAGYATVLGKGGKERVVPLGQHAREAILDYLGGERPRLLRGRASALLFVRAGGRPLSRQSVWKLGRARGPPGGVAAPPPAPPVRPAPPGRRCGPAGRAGTAGPCRHRDHAGLPPRRAGAAAGRPPPPPSPGLRATWRCSCTAPGAPDTLP